MYKTPTGNIKRACKFDGRFNYNKDTHFSSLFCRLILSISSLLPSEIDRGITLSLNRDLNSIEFAGRAVQ